MKIAEKGARGGQDKMNTDAYKVKRLRAGDKWRLFEDAKELCV